MAELQLLLAAAAAAVAAAAAAAAAPGAAGTALASGMSGTLPMYMKSIQRLVGVFQQRFGPWRRYLPAHAPHFMEVDWLNKMWRDLPAEYEQTSAAHLRWAGVV